MKAFRIIWFLLCLIPFSGKAQVTIQVLSASDSTPIPYAGCWLPSSRTSVTADSNGTLGLPGMQPKDSLWILMNGYSTWKGTWGLIRNASVLLHPLQTDSVVISSERPGMTLDPFPMKVEKYSPEAFRSVPDADISSGLDQLGGLRKQVNCGICGTADIHLNGMEGAYTTYLLNGIPLCGSLANIYGIYSVPVALLREVRITRGPASVWNGPEGAGGTIGFEFLQPGQGAGRGMAGLMQSGFGETTLDFGWMKGSQVLAWSAYRMAGRIDGNRDGFTDLPLADRHTLFWSFGQDTSFLSGMVKGYFEDRNGGQLDYRPGIHKGGEEVYGEYIRIRRLDATWRSTWMGNRWKGQVMGGYAFHHQNSWYGSTHIWAEQNSAFLTLRMQDPGRRFTGGTQVRFQSLQDNTPVSAGSLANWVIPALVAEYHSDSARLQWIGGARLDLTPFGWVPVVRGGLLRQFTPFRSMRLSAGTAYRMVNVFTEDHASLTGSRTVWVPDDLRPESVTGLLLNYNALIPLGSGLIAADADLFHTRFRDQVFADYSRDGFIVYQNLDGASWLWGMNVNIRGSWGEGWQAATGISMIRGQYIEDDGARESPYLTPGWMVTGEIRYASPGSRWEWMISGKGTGSMRLPEHDTAPGRSRPFGTCNLTLYRSWNHGWKGMVSFQNITGYRIPEPILGADDPWGSTFDTTRIYGPVTGIRIMAGISRKW